MTLESNINEVLPEEMLKQIFHLLPLGAVLVGSLALSLDKKFSPGDLKSAVLVCTHWASVGQASTLWASVVHIRVHQVILPAFFVMQTIP